MNPTTDTSEAQPARRSAARSGHAASAGALWASAFVLGGLILTQADRLGAGARASAEMVSETGGYTVMTADGGTDEVLVLLDHRDENVYVYSIENQQAIVLHQRLSLPKLFSDAQAKRRGMPARPGN